MYTGHHVFKKSLIGYISEIVVHELASIGMYSTKDFKPTELLNIPVC